jgi:hypothetical protein
MCNIKELKDVQLQFQLNEIVQDCVQLRKEAKDTILELSKWLNIDRRKLANFEKGYFDIELTNSILNYYNQKLYIYNM